MNKDVAHVKPKEAYMLVYCRRDGSAVWKQHENDDAEVVQIDEDDDRGGGSGNRGGASCSSGVVGSPSNRRRRRKSGAASPRPAASPLIREATTPEQRAKAARFCSEPGAADDIEISPKRVAGSGGGVGASSSGGPVSADPVVRKGDEIVSSPLPRRRLGRKTSAPELESEVASPSLISVKRTRRQTNSPPATRTASGLSSEEHVSRELHVEAATPSIEDVSTVPVAKAKPLLRLRRATGVNVSACSAPEIAAAVGAGLMSDGRDASSASAAAPSHAAGVAPGGPAASSASTAAPASALRRSSRLAASNARGQNVEGADASDTRAIVEANRELEIC